MIAEACFVKGSLSNIRHIAGKTGGLLVIRGGLADQSSYWQDFFSPEREYFIGLIE
jgi:hypothetical protein